MKIAITGDLHLKTRKESEQRYKALEEIIKICQNNNIENIIIAGDLFDENFNNFYDFDMLCRTNSNIKFYIIPGNHDVQIQQNHFSAPNIKIFNVPEIKYFDEYPFLFVPYNRGRSLDELLAEFWHNKDIPTEWVLIGHGDYVSSVKIFNEYEKGLYMPISTKAISIYNPSKVILGHIHKPNEIGKVTYPGSPFPLDINETGKRSFVIFDTATNKIDRIDIPPQVIYFIETILVVPIQNEEDYVYNQLSKIINSWELEDCEIEKVILRLYLKGFTKNYQNVINYVYQQLKKFNLQLYDNALIANELYQITPDDEKITILKEVEKLIANCNELKFTSKEKIFEKSIELIFNDK